ncbi:protein FAR-RED IMPAIRED RESPONSE 1-like [Salvia splendens]|uniref:protein FAR-RED IMPAIRED RESPONSE 1-like n=1 Tax=Salvia splendens TaxID=180675 RepID=UPI001C27F964|nr:protein FAR-RED IMPAIRED RESPONSE 1-like [Salvia splendens]
MANSNINDILYDMFGSDDEEGSQDETIREDNMHDSHEDTFDELLRDGPRYGMMFDSDTRLYEAYNSFAKKQGCRAHINAIKRYSGEWKVTTVELGHNHDLDPNMTALMASHRSLSMRMKRQLEENDIAGIRVCENIRLVEVQSGGPDKLGATPRDCRNFINERRRLRLGDGDANAIHKLFSSLQKKDPTFFHLMDLDEDLRLRNVMWIHPCSIAAYQDFHDVVSFDTTYLINQYQMPLATVVGVNHHNQSILLGCALLSHEHADSFKWFFSNWVEAMRGVHSTAILSDQCESIKIAVREVLPNTIHRLCLWHICQKIPQKFKGVAEYKRCSTEFYSMIYNNLSIVQFEERWAEFLSQHGLQTSRWLTDLYAERENWAPIYLNHYFWAGMVSTQRSESMHAFFDYYVNSQSTLKTFVEQYEVAINDKIRKELEADFQSKSWRPRLTSKYVWEGQFSRAYTLNLYKIFQEEINKICNCNVKEVACVGEDDVGGVERFEVLEMLIGCIEYHRQYTYIVDYRPSGEYISCNCRKFEFKAEYKETQEMEQDYQECVELGGSFEEKRKFLKKRNKETKKALINWKTPSPAASASVLAEEGISLEIVVGDPKVNRPRGRPEQKRFKSDVEKNRSRRK